MTGTQRRPARRRLWRWARVGVGATIVAGLGWRLGAGPFLDGVRRVHPAALVAALAITALTTVVSAWRWRLVAAQQGVPMPLGGAVASYYRSQFLNSTLPGGVLGDVQRGLRHGTEAGSLGRGLRSVVWDRAAGQVVQVAVAGLTLLAMTAPLRPELEVTAGVLLAALAVAALVLLVRRAWAAVAVASGVVVAGHTSVFVIAARAGGPAASTRVLLPLAMLVLLAMTVPTSIGGWGPREGVAAWAFAAAGLGADQGVATATTYGVLSLVATLPGAAVLLWARRPSWLGAVVPAHG